MVIEPEDGGQHDMVVDPVAVGYILADHLGKEQEQKLELTYPFVKE